MNTRRVAAVVMMVAAAGWLVPAAAGAQTPWVPAIPKYQPQGVPPKAFTPKSERPNTNGYREYGKRTLNINININPNNNQNTNFIRIQR